MFGVLGLATLLKLPLWWCEWRLLHAQAGHAARLGV